MKPTLTDDKIAATYRAAAQALPGAELDARILAAARQQLADRRQEKKRTGGDGWRRWRIPVSVTAVAVLGVSLSFRVSEEAALREPHRDQQPIDSRTAAPSEAAPAGAAVNALPPVNRPAPPSTDQPPPKPEARALPAPQASRDRGPASATADAAPPAATLQPMAQPVPVTPAAAPAPAKLTAPAPANVANAANALADESRQTDAPAVEARRAERESAAVPLRQRRDAASPAESTMEKKSALGVAGTVAESAAPAAAKAAAKKEAAPPPHRATPERWLDHIRQLKRDGQLPAAREELRRFQEQHPDYALPADLR